MKRNQQIEDFLSATNTSLSDGSFAKLTLGHYKGSDKDLKNISIKKVLIKRQEKLSFTFHYKTRDIVKNHTPEDAMGLIEDSLNTGFLAATLMTTGFDMTLETPSADKTILRKKDPTHKTPPTLTHDREKNRMIGTLGKPYLRDLKITDGNGNVLKTAQDKYRQINKYVEILSTLIKDIPPERLKKIVDMGSGKGYLTFALYDYLANTLKLEPQVTGVEFRPDMVDLCNKIAKASAFENLSFVQGSIENYDSTGANIMIALHACDTATDDAIYKGITAEAELIVVAPCCHKQIRREIESSKSHNDLDFLMKHGIFVERQSEMVTDALRAMILEYYGYTTKVFEFISDAHTPKNVLIVGIKNPKAKLKDPALLAKIRDAKVYFGITEHHLEKMLGI